MPQLDAWDIGTATLAAIVDTYADEGIELPDRQYQTAGQPADDCPQLVVWLNRIYNGLPEGESGRRETLGQPRTLELFARLVRCVPIVDQEGEAPSAADIQGDSVAIGRDLWVLPQGLIARKAAGEYLAQCQDFLLGDCTAIDWSGGVGGVQMLIRVQVDLTL